MNLTRYRTYGTLNGTADEDVYRVKHPGGCSDTFTIGLQGDDGHDVDLYFGAGEPSTNPTLTVQETSTSSTESTQVTGATAGQVYTLAIKHKVPTETPDSAYSITYEKSCGGSDPDRTPPVLQLDNVT
jgi:hypothetical protein